MSRWRKFLLGSLLALTGVVAIAGLVAAYARYRLAEQFPPPGQRVDVGGYRLHWHCQGQSQPTVVFEAGVNEFSVEWAVVQRELASTMRACVYDRAGLGWSERGPLPRTTANMVQELHTLLERTGTTGPLVLVGHSFGGLLMRAYQHAYPGNVVGLVLVDAAHEDYLQRIPEIRRGLDSAVGNFRTLAWISRLGLMALSPEDIPARGLHGEALDRYRAVLATGTYFETAAEETARFEQNLSDARALPLGGLQALPLVVLRRGQPDRLPFLSPAENEHYEHEWALLQQRLVALSTRSRLRVASRSDHMVPVNEPDVVVEAIHGVIAVGR